MVKPGFKSGKSGFRECVLNHYVSSLSCYSGMLWFDKTINGQNRKFPGGLVVRTPSLLRVWVLFLLIEGKCCFTMLLVSAIHQHDHHGLSTYVPPLEPCSTLLPHPTPLGCHRASVSGFDPGWETKVIQVVQHGQKEKKLEV